MDPLELPTDLTTLTPDQLAEAVTAARDRAAQIRDTDPGEVTDAMLDELDAIVGTDDAPGFLDRVADHEAAQVAASEARQARLDAAGTRLEAGDGDGEGEGDEGEGEGDDGGEGEGEGAEGAAAPLAAGGNRPSGSRIAGARSPRQPSRQTPAGNRLTMVASGASRDVAVGTELDVDQLVDSFIDISDAFRGMSTEAGTYDKRPVARMRREFRDGLTDTNPDYVVQAPIAASGRVRDRGFPDVMALFEAAGDEKRLSGGSLVASAGLAMKAAITAGGAPILASGGWCAPSVTDYDMPADETLDGLIDLPEAGITRGGVRFTLGPDFGTIFGNANGAFHQTEAQAIAGQLKPCQEVSCPDFQEVRLDAVGYCVKAPLLTNTAYPELVRRWIAGTVVANQHKVSASLITAMRNLLPAAQLLTPARSGGTVWSALTMLELAAEAQRQRWALAESTTMEVVLPRWFLLALRADLANRAHIGSDSVADAIIMQHFMDRKLRPQWVLHYTDLNTTANKPITWPTMAGTGSAAAGGTGFDNSGFQVIEAMIYPAGTFVKGTANVIDLSTVYDTGDLQTNVFTAAFVEDGVLIAKRKYGGYRVQLPVWSSGQMGANNLTTPWGSQTSSAAA